MATAYVFYLRDNVVGPCLDLIRSICNPESSSRPHITVRYPIDKLKDNDFTLYLNANIREIEIIEPGTFSTKDTTISPNHTVFLSCKSDILQGLSYKPDYPYSIFHITLYEGPSLKFAKQLLKILQCFPWGFIVQLPEHTKLTQIEIGKTQKNNSKSKTYSKKLKSLFRTITSEILSLSLLTSLSNAQRLEFTKAICYYLQNATMHFPKVALLSTSYNKTKFDISLKIKKQKIDSQSVKSNEVKTGESQLFSLNKALFLTPPELANDIVRYVITKLNPDTYPIDFGDPAIGTGVFFSTLLNAIGKDKINSAIGIDIDVKMVEETRNQWSHKGLDVEHGDYLHMDRLPKRTLIIANPPYVRYQDIPPEYKKKLQERASAQMGMRISGQSSIYVYFLLLSHGWMIKEALAAWLIPSEFMETNYGLVIRQYLTQKVELLRIHRFNPDNIQFENALVSSAVVVYRNHPPNADQKVLLSGGGNLLNPEYTEEVTLHDLNQESKWKVPWIHRQKSSSLPPRIGDLFSVHRGLATGANTYFIMERGIAKQRGIPELALRPILPKARALETDVIERETDGYPRVSPQLCLLDCDLPEEKIRTAYPRLMDYLKAASNTVLNSTLVRGRRPWYHQEQRQPAPFLITYMGRGSKNQTPLYFLWNKSDAIATNTYLMLYPSKALERLLNEQPDLLEKTFSLLKEIEFQDLSINGRVYGGGLHKIEPKEFLNVRLSSFPSWLKQAVFEYLPLV